MTSAQRTAVVVIVTLTCTATAPIRAATEDVRVETNAQVGSDAASPTEDVSLAVELGDGVPLVTAVDLTRGPLLTVQLQPTKLKKVSRKKAIIILAVVVTAVVLITYAVAIAGFHPAFTSLNEAGRIPAQVDQPPVATQP